MPSRHTPSRGPVLGTALAVALGIVTAANGASAQVTSATTGVKTPVLLRADAPLPGSGLTDPSLANGYNATFDGINLNGVGVIQTAEGNGLYATCTAERISARAVLTAAHCVTDENTGVLTSTSTNRTTAYFRGPSGGFTAYTASAAFVQSSWQGFYNPNTMAYQDVAILLFDNPLPSYITTYGIYNNGALGSETSLGQNVDMIGYGTFGNGAGATGFDFGRRVGNNVVDFVDNDPTSFSYGDLYTSFEDANNGYNSTCGVYGTSSPFCHASRGATEAGTAPGDSGGPLFINGLIAGVTSFGSYYCANAACDPYDVADLSRPTNAYGAINGFAPVSVNAAFIANVIAAPEPTTIALTGLGVLGVAAAARRRQRQG